MRSTATLVCEATKTRAGRISCICTGVPLRFAEVGAQVAVPPGAAMACSARRWTKVGGSPHGACGRRQRCSKWKHAAAVPCPRPAGHVDRVRLGMPALHHDCISDHGSSALLCPVQIVWACMPLRSPPQSAPFHALTGHASTPRLCPLPSARQSTLLPHLPCRRQQVDQCHQQRGFT
jgi:hypothetical protein